MPLCNDLSQIWGQQLYIDCNESVGHEGKAPGAHEGIESREVVQEVGARGSAEASGAEERAEGLTLEERPTHLRWAALGGRLDMGKVNVEIR